MTNPISKETLEMYVLSIKKNNNIIEALNSSLRELDGENSLFSLMSNDMLVSIDKILTEILGKEKFEWLSWWMWETNFGEKNTIVIYPDKTIVNVNNFSTLYNSFLVDN
jgi:hypothetical protein